MVEIISRQEAKTKGLKRYFTGEPCKNGHVCERTTKTCQCVLCDSEKAKRWRRANLAKDAEKSRRWQARNPEKARERSRKWREANPEKARAKSQRAQARYIAKDPERNREKGRRWRAANREKQTAATKRWMDENRERMREHWRARRARKLNAPGSHTEADVARIRQAQGDKCAWCRISLTRAKPQVDHIVPLTKGGSDYPSNLQILCQPCNVRKHNADPIEFAQRHGRLL